MSVLDKSVQVGKDLLEANGTSIRKFAEQEVEYFKKYVELNQDYLKKIPEIREVNAFIELQREYGQTLWTGVQDALRSRGEMVRDAVEQSNNIIRGAFNSEEVVEKAKSTVRKTKKAVAEKVEEAAA